MGGSCTVGEVEGGEGNPGGGTAGANAPRSERTLSGRGLWCNARSLMPLRRRFIHVIRRGEGRGEVEKLQPGTRGSFHSPLFLSHPAHPPQDHSEVPLWPNTGSPAQRVALANGPLSCHRPGAAGARLAGLASPSWQREDWYNNESIAAEPHGNKWERPQLS